MSFKRPIIPLHIQYSYIYIRRSSPCFSIPLVPPLCPLLLTWHPPAVTGIVHLSLRLLVNWPHLPHPSPNPPLPSKFPEPQLPSALQRRPREYSGSCYPEQLVSMRSERTDTSRVGETLDVTSETAETAGTRGTWWACSRHMLAQ
jgi:hypothetical protein